MVVQNFRKSDPTAWQFSNKHFKRGKPEELHLIKRKTKQSALDNTLVPGNAAIEVTHFLTDSVGLCHRFSAACGSNR